MKIALVSPYDWSVPGGVRSHIEHLAAELRLRGHHVAIIAPSSSHQPTASDAGIYHIGWVAPVRINGSVARVAITPALTGRLKRLMQYEQFDVVHLHEPMVSTLTLAMLRLAHAMQIPCVGTFHAASTKRTSTAAWAYAMASPFLQASFRRLDGCIAVSEAAKAHVSRVFAADYAIIPNGIDIDVFAPTVEPVAKYADGARNILFFSRLEPRKGLRYFLKAIPLIRDHMASATDRPLRFIIAGEGQHRARYEHFVQQQHWTDVVFEGFVPEAQKPGYFTAAEVYCAPATGSESQGIILLEAMASGTPVVASDIPGYRTVIPTAEYGFLMPPRDAERLAWAVCHLLRDEGLRQTLRHQARERAETYSWPRVAAAIEAVYLRSQTHHAEYQQQRRPWRFVPTRVFWRTSGTVGATNPSR